MTGQGQVFGDYRLLSVVGTGGMAEVCLAHQVGAHGFIKPCVVKRIVQDQAGNERYRRMFLEEARVSALLNHPNIVQTFDFGEVGGTPFMAMELVDGLNVAVLCKGLAERGRWLPLRAAIELSAQVAEALSYAHQLLGLDGRPLNLVHRDVSPQNILISRQGGVKLADFGIARHDARAEVTQGPSAKGKPGYMAPEQAMGEPIDPRADIYALGVVLTELVTAQRVASPRTTPSLAEGGIMAIPRRIQELLTSRPDLPFGLSELVAEMTALEAKDRCASAKLVADRLHRVADDLPPRPNLAMFIGQVFERFFPKTEGEALPPSAPDLSPVAPATEPRWEPAPEDEVQQPAARFDGWPEVDPAVAERPRTKVSGVREVDPTALELSFSGTSTSASRGAVPLSKEASRPTGLELALPDRLPAPPVAPESPLPSPPPVAPRPAWVVPGLAASAVLVIGLLGFWLRPRPPPPPPKGSVTVTSAPAGARILVDRFDTGRVTPDTIADLPVGREIRIELLAKGSVVVPSFQAIELHDDGDHASANFVVAPARVFRVATEPVGATLAIDDRPVVGTTPVDLPPIRLGTSATVAVTLDGFMPQKLVLHSAAQSATVAELRLEPAQRIEIDTEPVPAKLYVDQRYIGLAPISDAAVPLKRSFVLKAERLGYRTVKQVVQPQKIRAAKVELTLTELPLLSLPLSKEERTQAKQLTAARDRAQRAMSFAKNNLAKAQANLRKLESSRQSFVQVIADAESAVQEAQGKVDELEQILSEAETALDEFRGAVFGRLDAQAAATF